MKIAVGLAVDSALGPPVELAMDIAVDTAVSLAVKLAVRPYRRPPRYAVDVTVVCRGPCQLPRGLLWRPGGISGALAVGLAFAVIPWYAMANTVGCHYMPGTATGCRGNAAACHGHCRGTATKK